MAKIGFYIRKGQINKEGSTLIRAVVTVNYKKRTKVVGDVKPRHWNHTKQRVNKSRPNEPYNGWREINERLDRFQRNGEIYFANLKASGLQLTPEHVRDYFDGKSTIKEDVPDFWETWEQYIAVNSTDRAPGTIKSYRTTKKYLIEFQEYRGQNIDFQSINTVFLDDLKLYVLNEKQHAFNYFSVHLRKLKTFLKWCEARSIAVNREALSYKAPERRNEVFALTQEDFTTLYHFDFQSNSLLKARDIFCVGCLTGLRISDLRRLTRDHVKGDFFEIHMKKVKRDKPLKIPILPGVLPILYRYKDQFYLLPKLSDQKLNEYIKEAARVAGLTDTVRIMDFRKGIGEVMEKPKYELLTSHVMRKTFVSLAAKYNVSREVIKEITGIESESTLKHYLKTDTETILAEASKLNELFE